MGISPAYEGNPPLRREAKRETRPVGGIGRAVAADAVASVVKESEDSMMTERGRT